MVLHAFGYSLMLSHRYHIGESLLPSVRHFLRFVDAEEKVMSYGFVRKVSPIVSDHALLLLHVLTHRTSPEPSSSSIRT